MKQLMGEAIRTAKCIDSHADPQPCIIHTRPAETVTVVRVSKRALGAVPLGGFGFGANV